MCVLCFNHMDYRRNIADFCFVLSIRQDIDLTAVQLFGMKVVFLLSYCSIKKNNDRCIFEIECFHRVKNKQLTLRLRNANSELHKTIL